MQPKKILHSKQPKSSDTHAVDFISSLHKSLQEAQVAFINEN